MTEFARTVAGGNAKTWYFVLSTNALASVVLSVVRATGIIPPSSEGLVRVQSILLP